MGNWRAIGWLAAAAAVLALLGGCAEGAGDPDGTGSPSPPGVSPPTTGPTAGPTVGPSGTPHPPMPTVSPPSGPARTITGEVVEGVEAGCVLLRTGDRDYLLVGAEDEVRIGRTATVRGYPEPDLATICQEGTPFVVIEVVSS